MFKSRLLFAGAAAACLASAGGATFAAAHAEMFDAAAIPAPQTVTTILPAATPQPADPAEAQPAAPAPTTAPTPEVSPVAAPAPATAPRPEPVRRSASASGGDSELNCLARVILYEAGAESRAGQLAVAQVVINRTRSGRFPRTICGVINQRGQFSAIRSFRAPTGRRWSRALAIAREARAGGRAPGIGNALFFHAAHVPAFRGRTRVARLGGHIFYR